MHGVNEHNEQLVKLFLCRTPGLVLPRQQHDVAPLQRWHIQRSLQRDGVHHVSRRLLLCVRRCDGVRPVSRRRVRLVHGFSGVQPVSRWHVRRDHWCVGVLGHVRGRLRVPSGLGERDCSAVRQGLVERGWLG